MTNTVIIRTFRLPIATTPTADMTKIVIRTLRLPTDNTTKIDCRHSALQIHPDYRLYLPLHRHWREPNDCNSEMEQERKLQCQELMLNDKDWVEDMHMWAALKFLKKQFPRMGSLQDTLLSSNKDYMGFAAVSSPFV